MNRLQVLGGNYNRGIEVAHFAQQPAHLRVARTQVNFQHTVVADDQIVVHLFLALFFTLVLLDNVVVNRS